MTQKTIDIGAVADDGTGDTFRGAFDKANDNFDEIYKKSVLDNTITINSISDFGVQDADTITLEAGKNYIVGAAISTSKRFIVEPKVTVFDYSLGETNIWEYTGTGSQFTGVDVVNFNADGLTVRSALALETFTFSDTTPKTSIIVLSRFTFSGASGVISTPKIGTFTDVGTLQIVSAAGVSGLGVGDGITLSGTSMGVLSFSRFALISSSATYIGLDLGIAVVDTAFEISNMINIGLTAGSIGIKGLTSSGNVGTGVLGTIEKCEFIANITPLSGISISDLQLEFTGNSPIENSSKTMDSFLTASREVTISSPGVFVAINGTDWSSDIAERFSITNAGLATYLSAITTKVIVIATATLTKVGGGSDEIQMEIAINGTVQAKTVSSSDSPTPSSVTSQGVFTLTTNDTIQLFVSNIDSTSNISVSSADMSIINGF